MPNDLPGVFIDTNVWLYAFIESGDGKKSARARQTMKLVAPVVSTQVIHEVCVNLIKKAGFSEEQIRGLVTDFYQKYPVIEIDQTLILHASRLREHYGFSYWDSLIVAGALEAGVEWLYSEDMQNNLKVNGRLTIFNPFS